MRQTPRIKDSKIRKNDRTVRVFREILLKNNKEEDESQTKLNTEALGALLGTRQNNNDNNKYKKSKDVFPATSATSATLSDEDFDDVFVEGQFPAWFSCHLAITQLSGLTNIDGKPIHVCCKTKIDSQMKSKDKDGVL